MIVLDEESTMIDISSVTAAPEMFLWLLCEIVSKL
jgi:hypothetical protein